jgi:hypothetical protein
MIKKALDENGIKFAFPTVQIAGEDDASAATAAVAQRTLELTHPRSGLIRGDDVRPSLKIGPRRAKAHADQAERAHAALKSAVCAGILEIELERRETDPK